MQSYNKYVIQHNFQAKKYLPLSLFNIWRTISGNFGRIYGGFYVIS